MTGWRREGRPEARREKEKKTGAGRGEMLRERATGRGGRGGRRRGTSSRPSLAILLSFLIALSLFLASCASGGGSGKAGEGESEVVPVEPSGYDNHFSFLVCGDPHGRTDLLAEIISRAGEGEFLVVLGDITTGKGVEEMRRMKDFLDGSGITYHVIPGDNDMPGSSLKAFWEVFGADYYSLDIQETHLVFLNNAVAGVGCPPRELSWLREDLAGAVDKLVIAFAHVAPGAPVDIGKSGFVARESESNREMKDILAAAGAPVIYCGHIHAYMLYASGPPRVVVTGGAGARPHLSEESGGFHHFLRVIVENDQVREEVIPL
jgi:predicted phosphodiesterase